MKNTKTLLILFTSSLSHVFFATIFCMQSNITPLLNDPLTFLIAIEHANVNDVESYLNDGFDPNFISNETFLTPLGTACQMLSTKFKILQEQIEILDTDWCGCCKMAPLSNLEDEIESLETIILLLVDRTGPPTTMNERANRKNALQLLKENNQNIVAFKLEQNIFCGNVDTQEDDE
jgi:hypothetical protein